MSLSMGRKEATKMVRGGRIPTSLGKNLNKRKETNIPHEAINFCSRVDLNPFFRPMVKV